MTNLCFLMTLTMTTWLLTITTCFDVYKLLVQLELIKRLSLKQKVILNDWPICWVGVFSRSNFVVYLFILFSQFKVAYLMKSYQMSFLQKPFLVSSPKTKPTKCSQTFCCSEFGALSVLFTFFFSFTHTHTLIYTPLWRPFYCRQYNREKPILCISTNNHQKSSFSRPVEKTNKITLSGSR